MGREGPVRKGVDREGRILTDLNLADIRFIDFGRICLVDVSAIRMMTVGLLLPWTAMVPTVFGSPTTTPSMGAVMTVSATSDSAWAKVLTAVS